MQLIWFHLYPVFLKVFFNYTLVLRRKFTLDWEVKKQVGQLVIKGTKHQVRIPLFKFPFQNYSAEKDCFHFAYHWITSDYCLHYHHIQKTSTAEYRPHPRFSITTGPVLLRLLVLSCFSRSLWLHRPLFRSIDQPTAT